MDELLKILEDMHPDVDFRQCDNLIKDKVLDSFDIVTLLAEIDGEFGVTIPVEEITPDNFDSAQALYALITRLSDDL
ncbi:phosphopantetheine-binding protein [Cohnella lupini]|uniref:Phosphopantetheine binding protein n=1 Tax=Cohnella lupini TaxID=1294267 RepID=A0A3D9I066_9BACL|nr:phosphopantetheine-binding protein [Cohnella lupini]RED55113.1 phosphopantetheine binding protein [Cohnella lupini]